MGYGGQQGNRVRNKSSSPPKQTALSGCSLEGCKDGPNPFATENVKWLRNQRRTSSGARRSPNVRRRSASATRQRVRQQHVEQTVLQALERLSKRDTLELGSRQLQEVLVGLEPQRLVWFLRTVFDDKKPLQSVLARREQLLLLTTLVQQFPDTVLSSNALQDRILPTLLGALRMSDIQDTVARVCCEIFSHLCPDGDVEKFLAVCPIVVKAFLDPLVLGAGWDTLRKQRCLSVFGAVVPVVLAKAMLVDTEPRVQATLAGFVSLLCHGLAANPGLHEGLLQCLVHIASCGGDSLAPHAHRLAETCAKHLSETPSVVPAYAQPSVPAESGHGESPPRRFILTRELALVCCVCLKHLADSVAPLLTKPAHEELLKLRPTVEVALGRENLNLQRLTRGNEPLRVAITHAWQAWHVMSTQAPLPRRPQSPGALSGPWQCDGAYSRQRQLRDLAQPLIENQVPDMRPGSRPLPAPQQQQQHQRRPRPASAGHCVRPPNPKPAAARHLAHRPSDIAQGAMSKHLARQLSAEPIANDGEESMEHAEEEFGMLSVASEPRRETSGLRSLQAARQQQQRQRRQGPASAGQGVRPPKPARQMAHQEPHAAQDDMPQHLVRQLSSDLLSIDGEGIQHLEEELDMVALASAPHRDTSGSISLPAPQQQQQHQRRKGPSQCVRPPKPARHIAQRQSDVALDDMSQHLVQQRSSEPLLSDGEEGMQHAEEELDMLALASAPHRDTSGSRLPAPQEQQQRQQQRQASKPARHTAHRQSDVTQDHMSQQQLVRQLSSEPLLSDGEEGMHHTEEELDMVALASAPHRDTSGSRSLPRQEKQQQRQASKPVGQCVQPPTPGRHSAHRQSDVAREHMSQQQLVRQLSSEPLSSDGEEGMHHAEEELDMLANASEPRRETSGSRSLPAPQQQQRQQQRQASKPNRHIAQRQSDVTQDHMSKHLVRQLSTEPLMSDGEDAMQDDEEELVMQTVASEHPREMSGSRSLPAQQPQQQRQRQQQEPATAGHCVWPPKPARHIAHQELDVTQDHMSQHVVRQLSTEPLMSDGEAGRDHRFHAAHVVTVQQAEREQLHTTVIEAPRGERRRTAPVAPPAAPPTQRLHAPAANMEVESPFCDLEDHVPEPLITWTVPPDGDAPGLGSALRSLQTGSVVEAFQCVFSIGNEKTLQSILAYLHPEAVWQELPEEECKHLAHLLARVICKEPFADFSLTACDWLSVLLRWPAGQAAINMQDREELRPSLFALSGSAGTAGRSAASLYYCLFEETQQS